MAMNLKVMRLPKFSLLILAGLVDRTVSHGYVESPRSRNFRAHEEGREYDQNGLNRKATSSNRFGSGLCGVSPAGKNYDTFLGDWSSEAMYNEGGVIEITSRLTAYHGGHIEVNACADPKPDQSCFDANKLMYKGGGHPRDPNFPERAYLGTTSDRGSIYTHRFRLPLHLSGERVLLQWRYYTANSCQPEGYNEYFEDRGWIRSGLGQCDEKTYDDTGGTVPERFWNCIEVTIRDVTRPYLPSDEEYDMIQYDAVEESESISIDDVDMRDSVSQSVAASECHSHSNTCGPLLTCPNGACCSQWGYCGWTDAHCNECCQSNCKAYGK